MRETSPEVLRKVIAISTDFETDDLNISEDNKSIIKQEVEVSVYFVCVLIMIIRSMTIRRTLSMIDENVNFDVGFVVYLFRIINS